MSVQPEYASLLQKLVEGVDPDALSDDEFDQLEFFTSSGFVTIDNHPDAPGWELGFLNFRTVQDQFNHVTFKIIDLTDNKVGDSIREALLTAGLKESDTPRLTIAVSDSYQNLNKGAVSLYSSVHLDNEPMIAAVESSGRKQAFYRTKKSLRKS
jgi:hypothetical protein